MLQLGASAEYGNVQGAVFNIVTRQGGNLFHGDANVYFQNDGLTGRNTDRRRRRRLSLPPRQVAGHDACRRPDRSCADKLLVLRLVPVSARLGLAARRRSGLSGEERHAARVLEVQLQHQRRTIG